MNVTAYQCHIYNGSHGYRRERKLYMSMRRELFSSSSYAYCLYIVVQLWINKLDQNNNLISFQFIFSNDILSKAVFKLNLFNDATILDIEH